MEKFDPKHQTWSRLPVSEEGVQAGEGGGRGSRGRLGGNLAVDSMSRGSVTGTDH